MQYWTNHSLPVVVVLYHPETEHCHWQLQPEDAGSHPRKHCYSTNVQIAIDAGARLVIAAGDPSGGRNDCTVYPALQPSLLPG